MTDPRDETIARLKSDNALLRSTVAWYVRVYERWEDAVSDILGRKPETGLHIQRARDCLDIVGWPEEQERAMEETNPYLCIWAEDADGNWETSCGEMHCFFNGGVEDNEYRHCPYCGRRIEERRYEG